MSTIPRRRQPQKKQQPKSEGEKGIEKTSSSSDSAPTASEVATYNSGRLQKLLQVCTGNTGKEVQLSFEAGVLASWNPFFLFIINSEHNISRAFDECPIEFIPRPQPPIKSGIVVLEDDDDETKDESIDKSNLAYHVSAVAKRDIFSGEIVAFFTPKYIRLLGVSTIFDCHLDQANNKLKVGATTNADATDEFEDFVQMHPLPASAITGMHIVPECSALPKSAWVGGGLLGDFDVAEWVAYVTSKKEMQTLTPDMDGLRSYVKHYVSILWSRQNCAYLLDDSARNRPIIPVCATKQIKKGEKLVLAQDLSFSINHSELREETYEAFCKLLLDTKIVDELNVLIEEERAKLTPPVAAVATSSAPTS